MTGMESDIPESGQGLEMPDLPNEVLAELFLYFGKKTLLESRLVCRRWKVLASMRCRDMNFEIINSAQWESLHTKDGGKDPNKIFVDENTFGDWDYENSPWSKCQYLLPSKPFAHFFTHIGYNLEVLHVIGDDPSTVQKILELTPNLEKLKISLLPIETDPKIRVDSGRNFKRDRDPIHYLASSGNWYFGTESNQPQPGSASTKIASLRTQAVKNLVGAITTLSGMEAPEPEIPSYPTLANLTHLNLAITGLPSVELLELIVTKSNAPLRHVFVNLTRRAWKCAAQVAQLIANIPSIGCELHYSKSSGKEIVRIFQDLKIRKLALNIYHPFNKIRNFYSPLEEFLVGISDHLEHMRVKAFRYRAMHEKNIFRVYLRIPCLPNLKSLEFVKDQDFDVVREFPPPENKISTFLLLPKYTPFRFPFLQRFSGDEFPALKKLILTGTKEIVSFRSIPFPTVEELVLKSPHGFSDLSMRSWEGFAFPNLKILDATVYARNLTYIFSKFTKLEELTLTLERGVLNRSKSKSLIHKSDTNVLLSGIPKPNQACQGSAELIHGLIATNTRPSIHSLSKLKVLKLIFYEVRCDSCFNKPLNDSGIILGLLPLQPLELLLISQSHWKTVTYNGKILQYVISETNIDKLRSRHQNVEIVTMDPNETLPSFNGCDLHQ